MLAFKPTSVGSEPTNFSHIVFAFLCLLLPLMKATCGAAGVSDRVLHAHTQLPAVSCTHSCPGRYEMEPDAQDTCYNMF